MNRIIINADDFGLNEHNSRAIAEAFKKGLITDTTMMASGEFFNGAVDLAKREDFFDKIGIHLNLTEGEPLTEDIKKHERFVTNGRFNKKYGSAKCLTCAEADAIYKELTAQVKMLKGAGIKITHADSHHHIHTYFYIAPIALRVCRENGIDKIRILRQSVQDVRQRESFKLLLEQNGFITTKCFMYACDALDKIIPDNTEILTHPDFDKNGVLIDRRGFDSGIPSGYPLPDFNSKKHLTLTDYTRL